MARSSEQDQIQGGKVDDTKQNSNQSSAGPDAWAAVVAKRLGFNHDEALSLGKALAGLNAQSKGRRLGIFKPTPKDVKKVRQQERGEEFRVELLGRALPAVNTDDGVRAVVESKPITPDSVERYLESKFGEALPEARKAMMQLASALDPDELVQQGFSLYEQFRPKIPEGVSGWGAKGKLDLGRIRKLVACKARRIS